MSEVDVRCYAQDRHLVQVTLFRADWEGRAVSGTPGATLLPSMSVVHGSPSKLWNDGKAAHRAVEAILAMFGSPLAFGVNLMSQCSLLGSAPIHMVCFMKHMLHAVLSSGSLNRVTYD